MVSRSGETLAGYWAVHSAQQLPSNGEGSADSGRSHGKSVAVFSGGPCQPERIDASASEKPLEQACSVHLELDVPNSATA
jgi:hypothetical protein